MLKCLILLLCLAAETCLAGPSVNLIIWGQYVEPGIIEQFTDQTGINVNQSFYDTASMLRAKLISGNVGYDVAMPALSDIPKLVQADLLQPINDHDKITNLSQQDPELLAKTAKLDQQNRYGAIYQWGTTGIAYNKQKIAKILGPDAPTDSWQLLLNPKYLKQLQHCGVGFLDDPQAVYGIVLHYLGLNPNSVRPQDYQKAAYYMMRLRPYIMYFNNNNYMNDLASGNLCITMAYSGDAMRAEHMAEQTDNHVQIRYTIPKSGAPIWFDMLVIPKLAPNYSNGQKLINYLLRPKVAAANSNHNFQPNAIPKSKSYLRANLLDPQVTPSGSKLKNLFIVRHPPSTIESLYQSLWFKIRYGVKLD